MYFSVACFYQTMQQKFKVSSNLCKSLIHLFACLSLQFCLVFFLGCQFKYLEEPSSSLDCNPFISGSHWRMKCSLEMPPEYLSRIRVTWFFQRNGEINQFKYFLPSGKIKTHNYRKSGKLIYNSMVTVPILDINLHIGSIFCWIELDGNSSRFIPSTAVQIKESLSSYKYACPNERHSHIVDKCAGMNFRK